MCRIAFETSESFKVLRGGGLLWDTLYVHEKSYWKSRHILVKKQTHFSIILLNGFNNGFVKTYYVKKYTFFATVLVNSSVLTTITVSLT